MRIFPLSQAVLVLFLITTLTQEYVLSANSTLASSTTGNLTLLSISQSRDLETILSAIERALEFVEGNLEGIVVDAAMGTRVLEGLLAWS
jgi:hypothetical protein